MGLFGFSNVLKLGDRPSIHEEKNDELIKSWDFVVPNCCAAPFTVSHRIHVWYIC